MAGVKITVSYFAVGQLNQLPPEISNFLGQYRAGVQRPRRGLHRHVDGAVEKTGNVVKDGLVHLKTQFSPDHILLILLDTRQTAPVVEHLPHSDRVVRYPLDALPGRHSLLGLQDLFGLTI